MKSQKTLPLIAAASFTAMLAPFALAQGVGNPGQLPTYIPQNQPNGWLIIDATGTPLPVERDPNGPVWKKDLWGPNGAPLQIGPGQVYQLQEQLVVSGNLPWSDWHENILTPGWSWANPVFLVNGQVPAGFSFINNPTNFITGGDISFFFSSIPVGSVVDIRKDLVYSGVIPAPFPNIAVEQYPTPEPASLVLMGVGGLLALRRRARNVH